MFEPVHFFAASPESLMTDISRRVMLSQPEQLRCS
jgi:hypothetical protein